MKRIAFFSLLFCASCASSNTPAPQSAANETATATATVNNKELPPASGPSRAVELPPIRRSVLGNGLEVDTVKVDSLPIVYAELVVRTGAEADGSDKPGLAHLVASMLTEGTKHRSSAQLADDVDFLGSRVWATADAESLRIGMRSLKDNFENTFAIFSEMVTEPSFDKNELAKLKARELNRLALSEREPNYVTRREFMNALYGEHPYATTDTNEAALKSIDRKDLDVWKRRYLVGKNAFLVVVGDIEPAQADRIAAKFLSKLSAGALAYPKYPPIPTRNEREIVVVDRPGSVQSVIYIGNTSVPRNAADWVDLAVANQSAGWFRCIALVYGFTRKAKFDLRRVQPHRTATDRRTLRRFGVGPHAGHHRSGVRVLRSFEPNRDRTHASK
ncbi:MAG: pitrilysin family protein [Polyangiales bacterium]